MGGGGGGSDDKSSGNSEFWINMVQKHKPMNSGFPKCLNLYQNTSLMEIFSLYKMIIKFEN